MINNKIIQNVLSELELYYYEFDIEKKIFKHQVSSSIHISELVYITEFLSKCKIKYNVLENDYICVN